MGQGYCLDALNEWYSAVKSFTLPLSTTDTYCLEWCSQQLHRDLVAVEINRDVGTTSMFCYCSFSGGAVPNDINLSGYSPAASKIVLYPGVGAIQSTDATTSAVCYQNAVSTVIFALFLCHLIANSLIFNHSIRITITLQNQRNPQQKSQPPTQL